MASLDSIMGSQSGYGSYFNTGSAALGRGATASSGSARGGLVAGLGLIAAALGPIGIIGGVIGGLVAGFGASSANRARRELSRIEQARINTEMLWSGVKLIFDQQDVGRDTTKKLGAAALLTQEGLSHEEATASALNDPFVATENLRLDFDLREIVSNLAKQDSATRGKSTNVGLATISGVLSGAGLGMGVTQAMARVEQNRVRGGATASLLEAQLQGANEQGGINRQIGAATLGNVERAGSLNSQYYSALIKRANNSLQTSRNLTAGAGLRLDFSRRWMPPGGRISQDNIDVWNTMWGGVGGVGSFSGASTLPPWARRIAN